MFSRVGGGGPGGSTGLQGNLLWFSLLRCPPVSGGPGVGGIWCIWLTTPFFQDYVREGESKNYLSLRFVGSVLLTLQSLDFFFSNERGKLFKEGKRLGVKRGRHFPDDLKEGRPLVLPPEPFGPCRSF